MRKENLKIHACILLLGLVGICIKFGTAVSSEIEHERNVSVNATMPKNDVNTIELSAADNPHTRPEFALGASKEYMKIPKDIEKDIDRILADLEEMTKRAQRNLSHVW